MPHRMCEVRVCQARHLTSRNSADVAEKRDKRSAVTGLCVLISHNGIHVPTEVCRDIENPTWQRIASFQLVLYDSVEVPAAAQREPSAGTEVPQVEHVTNDEQVMQSLNPFAKNFVPPEDLPRRPILPPASPPKSSTPLAPSVIGGTPRSSQVVHFHVLSDILFSRELLGDVAMDVTPLLETAHDEVSILATDRLGHVKGKLGLSSLSPAEGLAVDTWVALRQKSGELRVQILIKPVSSAPELSEGNGSTGRSKSLARIRSSSAALHLMHRSSSSTDVNASHPLVAARDQGATRAMGQQQGSSHDSTEVSDRIAMSGGTVRSQMSIGHTTRIGAWPEFDNLARDGAVKVSVPSLHGPLDDRLLKTQEQYDFSAARGYREGKPDQDAGKGLRKSVAEGKVEVPEWPPSVGKRAQLQRDMHLAALRNRRQCVAWAEKFGSSSAMQQALRSPPSFGVLRRKRVGQTTHSRIPTSSVVFQQMGVELTDLVRRGIPDSLQQRTAILAETEGQRDRGLGGAFQGDDAEPSFLNGVTTAIPRAEVVRASGRLCYAEYQVQVKRKAFGDSWFVIRRYSDFRQLYDNLPRSFAAITPPLPPKSWRSLSFLSMTAEFLEDRRIALEVALRRLAINAARADSVVQADVRAFLGFPATSSTEAFAAVDPEIARHLARVPSQLELALPTRGPRPVSLLSNLRVTMWMLLSGAAHKSSITEDREQYSALDTISDERHWRRQGGTVEDYHLAQSVFKTIDEDVNRTNVRDSDERERLRRILKAFALKNPSTGYCQGMNSVALFLGRTAGGREDICFWLLDALATTVMPNHWRGLSHISATAGGVTLRLLMVEHLPQLLEHLDAHGLPPEILVCDFFLSLGCRALPPLSVLRVFDVLFWEGRDTLQCVALAVLHLAEEELLSVGGASAISDCLASCTICMHDADSLIEYAEMAMAKTSGKTRKTMRRESSALNDGRSGNRRTT